MKMFLHGSAMLAVLALSADPVLSKAHDMGKADPPRGVGELTTSEFIKSLDGSGVSGLVNGGQRGDAASRLRGDNRTIPVHKLPDEPTIEQ